MKYEALLHFLENVKGIEVIPVEQVPGEFNRDIQFTVKGKLYTIEWYVNLMTLYIGSAANMNPSVSFTELGLYFYSCRSNESLYFCDNYKRMIVNEAPSIKFEIPITGNGEERVNRHAGHPAFYPAPKEVYEAAY